MRICEHELGQQCHRGHHCEQEGPPHPYLHAPHSKDTMGPLSQNSEQLFGAEKEQD